MRRFDSWKITELEETFGLQEVNINFAPLDEWLAQAVGNVANSQKDERIYDVLDKYRKDLLSNGPYWNEEELKLYFIAPLLQTAGYPALSTLGWKGFAGRYLKAEIPSEKGTISVGGYVDFAVARGKDVIQTPIFFLHEYKQEDKRGTGPRGQLLIEMLTAWTLNADRLPIYGCYVLGRTWVFCVLKEKQYAFSGGFNAEEPEKIYQIYAVLANISAFARGRGV